MIRAYLFGCENGMLFCITSAKSGIIRTEVVLWQKDCQGERSD